MANVDERIVEMTFKGQSFLAGAKSTLDALKNLKAGLSNLKSGSKDINDLENAGKKFSLSGMQNGIDAVVHHFNLLRIAGLTVFTSLVRQGLFAGERLLKALTIDPIKAGLNVYETKINAIKTILANTQSEGTNLKQVTAALNQLNKYANLTVFNFGEMTRNIGTFTAAGVGLKTSVESIKGISNLAALSGSTSQQASTAMFQLSQAIASGTVKLQDWNSVVNAGLGGKVFQNAILQTAKVNGVAVDAMIKKYGSFRNALQSGFLTAKILTQTLSQFTGDLSAKQLRAMGFTQQQTAAIIKQAQAALSSATQIRTVSQLHQALAEEVATAWSHVWEAVIGNVNEATKTLSAVHTVLENALTGPVNNFAKFLEEFNKLGGREEIIKAITNTFRFLGEVLAPIKDAFRTIFPPATAQSVFNLAKSIEQFTERLHVSSQTAQEIKSIFSGLFSILKIGIDLIAAVAHGIAEMFGSAGQAGGGLLKLGGQLGDFITNIKNTIESGGALTKFFEGLGKVLALPLKAIAAIVNALADLPNAIAAITTFLQPVFAKIREFFSGFTNAIAQGIQSGNFQKLATLVNTLLGGSILLAIRSFIKNLTKSGGGGGLFASIKESFEGLTKTLEVMQANLKSGILQRIAIAVALLAASLLVLSFINPKDLAKALAGLTVIFLELALALKAVTGIAEAGGIVKMAAIGVELNALAIAITILAGAVAILSRFSLSELAKGLGAIAILLGELVGTTALLSKDSSGLIASSLAMIAMAVAINLLALAVRNLGKLDVGTLTKGIVSIAAILAILAGFNAISGAQLIGTAVAMVILGAALNVIAAAVKTLGSLSVDTLAKGIVSIAVALGIIAIAMSAMPPDMLVTSAALLIVAAALVVLSNALTNLGGMSWEAIAKSLIELAVALGIIAAAMILMTEALPGAAALLVVSAALAVLAPVLVVLGSLSWESIAKGLVALAGAFTIIGLAGLLLTPLVPTLLGLGIAIALFGVGILAAGAGVLLFATALTALGLALATTGAGIATFVLSLVSLLPQIGTKLGDAVVNLAKTIARGGAAITAAFVTLLASLLKGIIKVTPLIQKAIDTILKSFLEIINKNSGPIINTLGNLLLKMLNGMQKFVPKFVSKGTDLLVAVINGIKSQVNRVVTAATNVVIAFINAIGSNTLRVTHAGIEMIIHLINGLASQIQNSSGRLRSAAGNLGFAVIDGLSFGLLSKAQGLYNQLKGIADKIISTLSFGLLSHSPSRRAIPLGESVITGLMAGLAARTPELEQSVVDTGNTMLDALRTTLSGTVGDNLDVQPRITPVVDLTEARKGFGELATLSKSQTSIASLSTSKATSISASNAAAAEQAGLLRTQADVNLNFTQNNNSPVPLSATTIYRQTKNQLSIAKGALAKNANVG